jgi:hypothetical protein
MHAAGLPRSALKSLFAATFVACCLLPVACYLSLSLPPIIAGFEVNQFGLLNTALFYLAALLAVALRGT